MCQVVSIGQYCQLVRFIDNFVLDKFVLDKFGLDEFDLDEFVLAQTT